jgi:hypothetical protein
MFVLFADSSSQVMFVNKLSAWGGDSVFEPPGVQQPSVFDPKSSSLFLNNMTR